MVIVRANATYVVVEHRTQLHDRIARLWVRFNDDGGELVVEAAAGWRAALCGDDDLRNHLPHAQPRGSPCSPRSDVDRQREQNYAPFLAVLSDAGGAQPATSREATRFAITCTRYVKAAIKHAKTAALCFETVLAGFPTLSLFPKVETGVLTCDARSRTGATKGCGVCWYAVALDD